MKAHVSSASVKSTHLRRRSTAVTSLRELRVTYECHHNLYSTVVLYRENFSGVAATEAFLQVKSKRTPWTLLVHLPLSSRSWGKCQSALAALGRGWISPIQGRGRPSSSRSPICLFRRERSGFIERTRTFLNAKFCTRGNVGSNYRFCDATANRFPLKFSSQVFCSKLLVDPER